MGPVVPAGAMAPGDFALRPGTAREAGRGWAGDVAVVVRCSWRAMAAILLVTMVLPLLPLSGLIADGATVGATIGSNGKDSALIVAARRRSQLLSC